MHGDQRAMIDKFQWCAVLSAVLLGVIFSAVVESRPASLGDIRTLNLHFPQDTFHDYVVRYPQDGPPMQVPVRRPPHYIVAQPDLANPVRKPITILGKIVKTVPNSGPYRGINIPALPHVYNVNNDPSKSHNAQRSGDFTQNLHHPEEKRESPPMKPPMSQSSLSKGGPEAAKSALPPTTFPVATQKLDSKHNATTTAANRKFPTAENNETSVPTSELNRLKKLENLQKPLNTSTEGSEHKIQEEAASLEHQQKAPKYSTKLLDPAIQDGTSGVDNEKSPKSPTEVLEHAIQAGAKALDQGKPQKAHNIEVPAHDIQNGTATLGQHQESLEKPKDASERKIHNETVEVDQQQSPQNSSEAADSAINNTISATDSRIPPKSSKEVLETNVEEGAKALDQEKPPEAPNTEILAHEIKNETAALVQQESPQISAAVLEHKINEGSAAASMKTSADVLDNEIQERAKELDQQTYPKNSTEVTEDEIQEEAQALDQQKSPKNSTEASEHEIQEGAKAVDQQKSPQSPLEISEHGNQAGAPANASKSEDNQISSNAEIPEEIEKQSPAPQESSQLNEIIMSSEQPEVQQKPAIPPESDSVPRTPLPTTESNSEVQQAPKGTESKTEAEERNAVASSDIILAQRIGMFTTTEALELQQPQTSTESSVVLQRAPEYSVAIQPPDRSELQEQPKTVLEPFIEQQRALPSTEKPQLNAAEVQKNPPSPIDASLLSYAAPKMEPPEVQQQAPSEITETPMIHQQEQQPSAVIEPSIQQELPQSSTEFEFSKSSSFIDSSLLSYSDSPVQPFEVEQQVPSSITDPSQVQQEEEQPDTDEAPFIPQQQSLPSVDKSQLNSIELQKPSIEAPFIPQQQSLPSEEKSQLNSIESQKPSLIDGSLLSYSARAAGPHEDQYKQKHQPKTAAEPSVQQQQSLPSTEKSKINAIEPQQKLPSSIIDGSLLSYSARAATHEDQRQHEQQNETVAEPSVQQQQSVPSTEKSQVNAIDAQKPPASSNYGSLLSYSARAAEPHEHQPKTVAEPPVMQQQSLPSTEKSQLNAIESQEPSPSSIDGSLLSYSGSPVQILGVEQQAPSAILESPMLHPHVQHPEKVAEPSRQQQQSLSSTEKSPLNAIEFHNPPAYAIDEALLLYSAPKKEPTEVQQESPSAVIEPPILQQPDTVAESSLQQQRPLPSTEKSQLNAIDFQKPPSVDASLLSYSASAVERPEVQQQLPSPITELPKVQQHEEGHDTLVRNDVSSKTLSPPVIHSGQKSASHVVKIKEGCPQQERPPSRTAVDTLVIVPILIFTGLNELNGSLNMLVSDGTKEDMNFKAIELTDDANFTEIFPPKIASILNNGPIMKILAQIRAAQMRKSNMKGSRSLPVQNNAGLAYPGAAPHSKDILPGSSALFDNYGKPFFRNRQAEKGNSDLFLESIKNRFLPKPRLPIGLKTEIDPASFHQQIRSLDFSNKYFGDSMSDRMGGEGLLEMTDPPVFAHQPQRNVSLRTASKVTLNALDENKESFSLPPLTVDPMSMIKAGINPMMPVGSNGRWNDVMKTGLPPNYLSGQVPNTVFRTGQIYGRRNPTART